MVPIIGSKSPIPGVPASAVRQQPDGSLTIDLGAMNRGDKVEFLLARHFELAGRVDRMDRCTEELVRLNYVAGAAIKALARACNKTEDEAIELVLEEATATRDEVRKRAEARKAGHALVDPGATTIRLTEALARWARRDGQPAPAAPAPLPAP